MKYYGVFLPIRPGLSHPVRGAWIEITVDNPSFLNSPSHPVRGAWIEMHWDRGLLAVPTVAPREGCVD